MTKGLYIRTKEIKKKTSDVLKGRHLSKKHKRKISEAMKGKKHKYSHKHSEETKKKMSESHKGKSHSEQTRKKLSKLFKGKKSWSWKGGVTPKYEKIRKSIEFRLWREAVFARDNWTCQKYKIKGGKLVAHHIRNFAKIIELRTSIENGITLSDKAHREFHKKYGEINNTKEQIEEFLAY